MTLVFPECAEDLGDAFNNALEKGTLSASPRDPAFWGFHDLLASEVEDGEIVTADWIYNKLANLHIRVSRKESPR